MRNLARDLRPLIMFTAGSLFTLTVVGGVALAQNDSIEACVKDNGEVRIVDTAEDCKENEMPLSWNVTGPVGPQGPQGPEGPAGPPGPATEFSWIRVAAANGSFTQIRGEDVVTVEKSPAVTGRYTITFDHDVDNCARNVAVHAGFSPGMSVEFTPVGNPRVIEVNTYFSDAFRTDMPFELTVWC